MIAPSPEMVDAIRHEQESYTSHPEVSGRPSGMPAWVRIVLWLAVAAGVAVVIVRFGLRFSRR